MAGLATVGTVTAGWAATGMATAGWAAADGRRAGCAEVWFRRGHRRGRNGVDIEGRDRRWGRGGEAARRGLWSGLGGKACTTSHTPCSTATHHIPPLPVVNPEGKEYGGGLGRTIGRTLAGYGGAPSPSSTATHHIHPCRCPGVSQGLVRAFGTPLVALLPPRRVEERLAC